MKDDMSDANSMNIKHTTSLEEQQTIHDLLQKKYDKNIEAAILHLSFRVHQKHNIK